MSRPETRSAALVAILGGAVAAFAACDSGAGLTTTPGPVATATTSSGGPTKPGELPGEGDGGSEEPDPVGWGDPKTVRRPGKLRLEQLNVRRLFDTTCDSGPGTCPTSFEEQATPDAFDRRVKQIADALAKVQADVITLAEVETQVALDAVQKSLKDAGFEYPIAYVAETGGAGSIDVAILARGALGTVKNYKKDTPLKRPDGTNTSFTRELPEIHLTFGKSEVVVFPAHFRSKSDDDPGRRIAEAAAAHDILVAAGAATKSALVLLGGDLNDTPGSEALNALEGDGKLLRVASDVTAQGTYKFGGVDQPIDHIFVTKEHAESYVAKSTTVVRDPGGKGFAGSDHATIWADFTLP